MIIDYETNKWIKKFWSLTKNKYEQEEKLENQKRKY